MAAEPTSDLLDDKAREAAAVPAAPPPVAVGRERVLAAFARNPTPPAPATLQPRPQPRPQVQTNREPLSEAAIDELLAGYAVGNLPWPRRLLGEEPGHPNCRISHAVLKRNRLA
jgi:hypothetical protein